jgi:hypothetical protein
MAAFELFLSANETAFAIFHLGGTGFVSQTDNDFFRSGASRGYP